jgi:hypothetical protein
MNDGDRTVEAIKSVAGKRLSYLDMVSHDGAPFDISKVQGKRHMRFSR